MLPHPLPRPSPSVPSCSHNPSPPLPVHAVLPNLAHLVPFTTLTPLFLHTVVPCRPHTVTPTNHPPFVARILQFLVPVTLSLHCVRNSSFPSFGLLGHSFLSRHSQSNPILVLTPRQIVSSRLLWLPSAFLAPRLPSFSPPFSCCPLLFPLHQATSLGLNPISVSTSTLN
ncbi:hypothetical protein CCUS01_03172 [Colletotrichum cuscutae]|uniref:Uncharacterized protein n=1 Tax=Colletotrichum cuscutae TaxID=1209917 RepID=A0AAI9Y9J5_9PEZI|nr:hypothetical protein CCUS01_03172 [Colletotrichum cuscutae]